MLTFIGTGNMATAMIRGVLVSGLLQAHEIGVFDLDQQKAEAFSAETGVCSFADTQTMIASSDAVVLSVKPNVLEQVLRQNGEALQQRDPLLISIAAGKTLSFLQSALPYEARLIRVMPNVNAQVGAAVSAFCGNERATQADLRFAKSFCGAFGLAMQLDEAKFPIFGVLGGCTPAYAFLFADALAEAGVQFGLPKQQALEISAQMLLGSAKLLLESEKHPRALIDQVCSPGGTTIEGLRILQKEGFESAIHDAVQAALEKDKKL